jgi:hypothetical protein
MIAINAVGNLTNDVGLSVVMAGSSSLPCAPLPHDCGGSRGADSSFGNNLFDSHKPGCMSQVNCCLSSSGQDPLAIIAVLSSLALANPPDFINDGSLGMTYPLNRSSGRLGSTPQITSYEKGR